MTDFRPVRVVRAPRGVRDLSPEDLRHATSSRYVEFLGGYGDVINRIHQCDWYVSLARLRQDESVTVGYLGHNPAGLDLFRWIPTRGRVLVLDVGFSGAWNDTSWRAERGLPDAHLHPYDIRRVEWWPSESDLEELDQLYRIGPYIAFVCSAGTPERNVPKPIVESAVSEARSAGFKIVLVGGNYRRNHADDSRPREEVRIPGRYGLVDMIDRLSGAGSVKAIERGAGTFTAHTGLCLASWYVRTPTFLLYDRFVRDTYVPLGLAGYLFGAGRPGNDHMEFSEYNVDRFRRFLKELK